MNKQNNIPPIRRQERQVTSPNKILGIIDRCEVCRLGISTEGAPYIVPLCFGYEEVDDVLRLYFHHATSGRLLDLLKANPRVAFELDRPVAFESSKVPSSSTYLYESVMGEGVVEIVQTFEEKQAALNQLMRHYTKQPTHEISEGCIVGVTVLRLTVDWLTAKSNLRK